MSKRLRLTLPVTRQSGKDKTVAAEKQQAKWLFWTIRA